MNEDDVNVSKNEAVTETQPAESETANQPAADANQTTETGSSETGTPDAAGSNSPENPQVTNLNKALSIEREARRKLQRQIAEMRGNPAGQAQGDEDVYSHPAYQEMALKNAAYELREGAKDILEGYPQIPQAVKNAILKNPRGYVNEGTSDVQNALLDIQDYVDSIAEEFGGTDGTTSQPKTVPIVGNNSQIGSQDRQDLEIQEILKLPPEEWTEEQAKAVDEYQKRNPKK